MRDFLFAESIHWISILHVCFTCGRTLAWSLPGGAPSEYHNGSRVSIQAIKMSSIRTQIPFDPYSIPYCKPDAKNLHYKAENLGEILRGDRLVNTLYEVYMLENRSCHVLCTGEGGTTAPLRWSDEETNMVISRIRNNYRVQLLVDNLPNAERVDGQKDHLHLELGYPLGHLDDMDNVVMHNFVQFTIYYHLSDKDNYRVVRFDVNSSSVSLQSIEVSDDKKCNVLIDQQPQFLVQNSETSMYYIYSVVWLPSEVKWASRWDSYFYMNPNESQIHWFSVTNSVVILLFLSGIVAIIMMRILRRDISRYNHLSSEDPLDECLEETGWKLVHGDVFRPPTNSRLLCALVGTGVQTYLMTFITLCLAMLGMLSPANRGSLVSSAIGFYNLMGIVAGYYSGRLYKTMKGLRWKSAALLTGTLFPSVSISILLFINIFMWHVGSSRAIPFLSIISLFTMWLGVSVPLVFIGSFFGYRRHPYQNPVRTNQIPRQIPDQSWYSGTFISSLMAGLLPFAATFIELVFIFSAIWFNQMYFVFGFLLVVFLILSLSCAQIVIVVVYFQLCSEDYRWWWRSFIVSGGSAIYVLAYAIYYMYKQLLVDNPLTFLLYIGYSFLMATVYWLITGTAGFWAAYWFVRKIYTAVKID